MLLQKISNSLLLSLVILFLFGACETKTSDKGTHGANNIVCDSVPIDSLNKLIAQNPKKASLYAERSEAFNNIGDSIKSINDLVTALSLDTLNVDYFIGLSDKYLLLGRSEKTREYLLKAIKIEPNNIQVLYRLGNLYFYVQNYKIALKYLTKTNAVDPFFAPAYFTLGMLYKELGDTVRAIEQLQIAVEREPDYYDAYMQLGSLNSALGNSIAFDYYKNALRILPNNYEVNYAMAMFYQNNEKPEQAIEVYKKILKSSPIRYSNVYYNLAYIEMIFFEEYKNAIIYFDSAIQIQKHYPAAFCNMAYCYEQLNDETNAKINYRKALQLEPNFNIAALGLERLKNK